MQDDDFPKLFDFTNDDREIVKQYGKLVIHRLDDFIEELYIFMQEQLGSDFPRHFPDEPTLRRARAAMRQAWSDFWDARWDAKYIESRRHVGEVHAQLQIEPRHYLSAMNKALTLWTEDLAPEEHSGTHRYEVTRAVRRAINMEAAMVVDVYSRRTSEVITQQSRALVDMSTPIAALWDGILMLPIVGFLDSRRAQDIMQRMLEQVAEKQADAFILDISGVAVVDTAVANHLIRMTKAARLMGCEAIVSGLSPAVAQTIVELGIEVGDMKTTGNLKDALKLSFQMVGAVPTK